MARNSYELIDNLVADLTPVKPMKTRVALMKLVLIAAASFAVLTYFWDVRDHLSALFLVSSVMYFVLSCAASYAVITMARPQIGADRSGWIWAAVMCSAIPLAALVLAIMDRGNFWYNSHSDVGVLCTAIATASASVVGIALVLWLRRGMPLSPELASLAVGLAAGSVGTFIFSLFCRADGLLHIGFWHSAPIIVSTLISRIIVPHLIRA